MPPRAEWACTSVVRLPRDARTTAERIASLPVATRASDGSTVTIPLGQVATIDAGMGPAQIDREDLERVVTIFANVAPGANLGDITKGIQQGVASIALPAGYTISLGGDSEEMAETSGYVGQSVLLAVILIYLILASQFGSFTQPFSIMFALPLSLVGVMLALLATGDTLNLMSMIGVLLLMGLVTKNAILLVDNANQQRREGKSMLDALVEAGVTRLRPIVMTTLAMIVGMIPIALGTGEGGALRAPMARAVIGGLLTSTLLTLVVVPVVCAYIDDAAEWLRKRRAGVTVRLSSADDPRGAPMSACAILRDAAASGSTIAVFEATHRGAAALLVTLLSPLVVLLATPAIRPFRWSRLFWTYLVPAIPLAVLFDGIVSCLRTYTPSEMLELTNGIDGATWEAGEDRTRGPVPMTYLIGTQCGNALARPSGDRVASPS